MEMYEQLLTKGPGAEAAAVRSVLCATSRAKLAAAWSLLKPYGACPLVQSAVEAAKARWAAPNLLRTKESIGHSPASRYQRDLAHGLLVEPALRDHWEWALPVLADAHLRWPQAVDLLDQLLLVRRRHPASLVTCTWVDCF